jgi:mRNA-degrading endonuclease RelE of RelBE toxin-antitoxin system
MYKVEIKHRTEKKIDSLPEKIQDRFYELINDLQEKGAIQRKWPNFSDLGKNNYHCHLDRRWVACWYSEKKSIVIEITYVGSREDAPY